MSRAEQLAGFGSAAAFRTPEHQSQARSAEGSSVFSLYSVLLNQVPKLYERHKHKPSKQRNTAIREDLTALLYADYASFLKEELGFTLYANVLDLSISSDGSITANDVRYADSGLADQCARAVQKALQEGDLERATRYKLEEEQTLLLLARAESAVDDLKQQFPHAFLGLLSELEARENELGPEWKQEEVTNLPPTLRERLSDINVSQTRFFRGKAFSYILPQSSIYPRGDAFWGRWTLWATLTTDSKPSFFVLNEQFMNQFSPEDHLLAQNSATSDHAQNTLGSTPPSEASLLHAVADVRPELAQLPFQDYIHSVLSSVELQKDLPILLGKQQQAMGAFSERKRLLWETSQTIADILLLEHARGVTADTETVLTIVNEAPMHSLITGGKFSGKGVWDAYKKIQPLRKKAGSFQKQQTGANSLREAFLTGVAKEMPQIRYSVLSQVDCAVGSFGGLSDKLQALQSSGSLQAGIPAFSNTGEALEYFRSDAFSKTQLEVLIGKTRALEWRYGTCVGCGAKTLVGECSLCYGCELESERFSLPETRRDSGSNKFSEEEASPFGWPPSERRSVGQFFFALFSPNSSVFGVKTELL